MQTNKFLFYQRGGGTHKMVYWTGGLDGIQGFSCD